MYYNKSIRSAKVASRFFEGFRTIYPEFHISLMGQWEPLRDKFDPGQAQIEWEKNRSQSSNEFGDYIFHGKRPVPFYIFVHWYLAASHLRWADGISVMFDDTLWTDSKISDVNERAIQLLRHLSNFDGALYGRSYHESEFETKDFKERVLKDGRASRESISLTPRQGIVDLFWSNFFGRAYVNIFGEQSLQQVICMRNERVENGFLLMFTKNPFHWNDPGVLALQKNAKTELDHDAFLDIAKDFQPNLNILPEPALDTPVR